MAFEDAQFTVTLSICPQPALGLCVPNRTWVSGEASSSLSGPEAAALRASHHHGTAQHTGLGDAGVLDSICPSPQLQDVEGGGPHTEDSASPFPTTAFMKPTGQAPSLCTAERENPGSEGKGFAGEW